MVVVKILFSFSTVCQMCIRDSPCTEKNPVYIQLHIGIFNFDNLSVHGLMTIQNRTTDLLVHIITYNIDIKHNSCSEFLCVIVIIIPSSPFSFKRYLLEYVRKCVFYDQVCD